MAEETERDSLGKDFESWLPSNLKAVPVNDREVEVSAGGRRSLAFGHVPGGVTVRIVKAGQSPLQLSAESVGRGVEWEISAPDSSAITLGQRFRKVRVTKPHNQRLQLLLSDSTAILELEPGTYDIGSNAESEVRTYSVRALPNGSSPSGPHSVQLKGSARVRAIWGEGEVEVGDVLKESAVVRDFSGKLRFSADVEALSIQASEADVRATGRASMRDTTLDVHRLDVGGDLEGCGDVQVKEGVRIRGSVADVRLHAGGRVHVQGSVTRSALSSDAVAANDDAAPAIYTGGGNPQVHPSHSEPSPAETNVVGGVVGSGRWGRDGKRRDAEDVSLKALNGTVATGPLARACVVATHLEVHGDFTAAAVDEEGDGTPPVVDVQESAWVKGVFELGDGVAKVGQALIVGGELSGGVVEAANAEVVLQGGATRTRVNAKNALLQGPSDGVGLTVVRAWIDGETSTSCSLAVSEYAELAKHFAGCIHVPPEADPTIQSHSGVGTVKAPPLGDDRENGAQLELAGGASVERLELDRPLAIAVGASEQDTRVGYVETSLPATRTEALRLRTQATVVVEHIAALAGSVRVVADRDDEEQSGKLCVAPPEGQSLQIDASIPVEVKTGGGTDPHRAPLVLAGSGNFTLTGRFENVHMQLQENESQGFPGLNVPAGSVVHRLTGDLRLEAIGGRVSGARELPADGVEHWHQLLLRPRRRIAPRLHAVAEQREEGPRHVVGVDPSNLPTDEVPRLSGLMVFSPDPRAMIAFGRNPEKDAFDRREAAQKAQEIATVVAGRAVSGSASTATKWAARRKHHRTTPPLEWLGRWAKWSVGYGQRPAPAASTWLGLVAALALALHLLDDPIAGAPADADGEHRGSPGWLAQFVRVLVLPAALLRLPEDEAAHLIAGEIHWHVLSFMVVGGALVSLFVALKNYLAATEGG